MLSVEVGTMNRSRWCCVGVAALVFVAGLGALAQPCAITVQPGESIQAAIDAAPDGATVCLAEGEYEEHITIEKSLTLSGAGAEKTTLRGVEDDLPVVAVYGSGEVQTVVALSGIHVGRNEGGQGGGLVIGGLHQGGAQATIEACTVSGHTTGILLQHTSEVTITDCAVYENTFDGIGVGGTVHVTITASTVSSNKYGIRSWASPEATISHSTISGNSRDGIFVFHSTRATILHSAVLGNVRDGIGVGGLAQATITGSTIRGSRCGVFVSSSAEVTIADSLIQDHAAYGVVLSGRPCFVTEDAFIGYVSGSGNTGGGNAEGDYCPETLAFLFTEEGGELDRREEE